MPIRGSNSMRHFDLLMRQNVFIINIYSPLCAINSDTVYVRSGLIEGM